eukprot:scaffold2615_cov116-Isochrysis_galbana.AAC.2
MFVPGSPAGIAFYVEFPAEPSRGLPRTERFHGSIFVGEEVTGRFVPAKAQYIGQLELLAALTPYTSLLGGNKLTKVGESCTGLTTQAPSRHCAR